MRNEEGREREGERGGADEHGVSLSRRTRGSEYDYKKKIIIKREEEEDIYIRI